MASRNGAPYPRLVADVGGSGARFGWVGGPGSGVDQIAACVDSGEGDIATAIADYLSAHAHPAPASCAIGIAAPVDGDTVSMTNRSSTFSVRDLQRRLRLERLLVINDFAALAFALTALAPEDVRRVGGGRARTGGARALLGPGTGLGVSGLLATADGHVPVVGEGGHVTLSASNEREDAVVAILRRRFGHVSAERVLSGPGIVNLYLAVCELEGSAAEPLDASLVTDRALGGGDSPCSRAVDLFFAFLGGVGGDLALTLGARGGVYVAGGIVGRLGDAIERSSFRERFEGKGRFRAYLSSIPTSVIGDSPALALRGANAALDASSPNSVRAP